MINQIEYQTVIDDYSTPGILYTCKADLWRWTDKPFWQIKAIDSTGSKMRPIDNNWFPSSDFIFKADDRATLTYSYD